MRLVQPSLFRVKGLRCRRRLCRRSPVWFQCRFSVTEPLGVVFGAAEHEAGAVILGP